MYFGSITLSLRSFFYEPDFNYKKNIFKYRTVGPVSVFLPQQEANHIFIIMDFMHSVPKSNIFYTHFFDELKLKNNIVVKSRNLLGIKPEI